MSGKDATKASAAQGARQWRPELRSLTPKVSRSDTISRKAWGHGAVAIEPPHVGRVLRQLKKLTEVSAHEIFTVVTEIYFPDLCGEPSICRDASLRGRLVYLALVAMVLSLVLAFTVLQSGMT
ncbi:hypothetical protein CTN06_04680 [Pectobacterium zantedeschiae]|uniref:Uncharacterized protein n=1 Tax=Pectobacterium zantedeschiae TaxID=2034769 RepID=A0A9X8P533_9GAMM|nr:hypothetical protein CLR69_02945 [Pectobacterium zantedeschiae]RYC48761.1 hypothetical protein CTN06_04680 [Pectobacterium zantedeschiae]